MKCFMMKLSISGFLFLDTHQFCSFSDMRDRPFSIDRMIILANQAPAELDGSDIRYIVEDVDEAARNCFGQSPTWVPQGPQVRKVIYYYIEN